jgi:hypothetical protein
VEDGDGVQDGVADVDAVFVGVWPRDRDADGVAVVEGVCDGLPVCDVVGVFVGVGVLLAVMLGVGSV